MNKPARYLFEIDFSTPPEPDEAEKEPVVPMLPVSEHEAILAAARAGAFEEGRRAGLEGVEAAELEARTASVRTIAEGIAAGIGEADRNRRGEEEKAIELALAAARKLASSLVAREPLAEITRLMSECLAPLRNAPHLVLRLNEALADDIKPICDKLAFEAGFEGRLVILGETDIQPGDCRVEWADGGQTLTMQETDAAIQSMVDRYLAARGGARGAETETTGEGAGDNREA